MQDIYKKIPSRLSEIYEGMYSKKGIDEVKLATYFDENIKEVMDFVSEVVPTVITIPEDVYKNLEPEVRYYLYNAFCLNFVLGVMFYPYDYEPEEIKEFTVNGNRYLMPTEDIMMGKNRPMHSLNALEYTNALDLRQVASKMKEGNLQYFAELICVIVKRKVDDKYTHTQINEYLSDIKELPMDTVWNVFFCLSSYVVRQLELLTSMKQAVHQLSTIPHGTTN